MLSKTFKINTKDFSQYAHKSGLSVVYTPIAGLEDKYTMDGTLHNDVLTNKATYTVRLNPVSPAIAKEILTEYKTDPITLTIFDVATGTDITILCKTRDATVAIALVQRGDITYWQLSDLVFIEK